MFPPRAFRTLSLCTSDKSRRYIGPPKLAVLALQRLEPLTIVAGQGRPACRACRTHSRSVPLVQPTFPPIEEIAAHCEPCSALRSGTSRTARVVTSRECIFLVAFRVAPCSQELSLQRTKERFKTERFLLFQSPRLRIY